MHIWSIQFLLCISEEKYVGGQPSDIQYTKDYLVLTLVDQLLCDCCGLSIMK